MIALTGGAEALGVPHPTPLPSLARDVLGVGAGGLGALTAARSLGGILGVAMVSALGPPPVGGDPAPPHGARRRWRDSRNARGSLALGRVGGSAAVVNTAGLSDLLSQSLMPLTVPHDLRGRVGRAWVVAVGLTPLGQLQIGGLASVFGVGVALGTSGIALMALAGFAPVRAPRLRGL